MKIIHKIAIIPLFMFANMAMATLHTNLYLTNDSTKTICIQHAYEVSDNQSLPLVTYHLLHRCLAPLDTQPMIALSRNKGVQKNEVYQFQFGFGKPDSGTEFVMQQRIMGTLLFSHMWLSASDNYTLNPGWFYDRDIHKLKLNDGNTDLWYRSTRSVSGPDNIYYVVQEKWRAPQRSNNVKQFRLLTYNVWGTTTPFDKGFIIPEKMSVRLQAIARHVHGYDAIVFDELFFKQYRHELLKLLAKEYPYHTKVAGVPGILTPGPFSGGSVIVSHWPIIKQARYTYKKTRGADILAAKGVSYAKIEKCATGGTQCMVYNLFGTQLRPDRAQADQHIRQKQLQAMASFIGQQHIPHDQPVLIAGDMNIHKYMLPDEYQKMLAILQAVEPHVGGHKYSYDDQLNTWAKGEGERDQLDYILYSREYLQPKSSMDQVLTPRSVNLALWTKWDLSDHFPMAGVFIFF